jgi:hypothetical protein
VPVAASLPEVEATLVQVVAAEAAGTPAMRAVDAAIASTETE